MLLLARLRVELDFCCLELLLRQFRLADAGIEARQSTMTPPDEGGTVTADLRACDNVPIIRDEFPESKKNLVPLVGPGYLHPGCGSDLNGA